jgi:beta-lactamase regulating signal transducer with metallopeptidase domain
MKTIIAEFTDRLLEISAEAAVLVFIILLVQRIFRDRLSASWRYALWFVVLCKLLLPVAPPSPLSLFNLAPGRLKTAGLGSAGQAMHPQETRSNPGIASSSTLDANGVLPGLRHGAKTDIRPLLAAVWAAGVVFLGVRMLRQNRRFSRLLRQSELSQDRQLLNVLSNCQRELKVKTSVSLVTTDVVSSPAIYGLLRPKLLLPRLATTLSAAQLRHIFLHELGHVKRRDMLVHWLVGCLRTVHWFNPVLWYGFRRMAGDREVACDELALTSAGPGGGRLYGETILHLLQSTVEPPSTVSTVGILERRSEIARRLSFIAGFKPRPRGAWLGVLLCVSLGVATLTAAKSQIEDPTTGNSPGSTPSRPSDARRDVFNPTPLTAPTDSKPNDSSLQDERTVTLRTLKDLRDNETELLEHDTDDHPRIVTLRRQIADLEERAKTLDSQIAAAKASQEKAAREIAHRAFLRRYGLVENPAKPDRQSTNSTDSSEAQRTRTREQFLLRYGLAPNRGDSNQPSDPFGGRNQAALLSRYGASTPLDGSGSLGAFGGQVGFSNRNVPLVVHVDAKGNFSLGSEPTPVTVAELRSKLTEEVARDPDARLQISADRNTPFGRIVTIMDIAKEAKIRGVNATTTGQGE